jgi:hypothetical protein
MNKPTLKLNNEPKLPHEVEREKQAQHAKVFERKVKQPQTITGHEVALAKMVKERRRIKVTFVNCESVEGELLEFDKFSIRVALDSGICEWFFKSNLKSFSEVGKNVR